MSHQEPKIPFSSELKELAGHLREVHRQAEALGLFVEDRLLLHCAGCGLREDVRFDGRLVTSLQGVADARDSGLRFEPSAGGFVCPLCHATLSVRDEGEDN